VIVAGQLVLVRHGETAWSLSGRHTGTTDVALTDTGCRQAQALAAKLAARAWAEVRTSPMARARATAELAGLGGAAVDPDLTEWDYGSVEGRTTEDLRRTMPGWSIWRDGPPGGETAEQVGTRAFHLLASVAPALDAGGDVVLFGHGHMFRILAATWLGLPAVAGRLFALDPASVSVLGHEREQRVVVGWNDGVARDGGTSR
jgi:probable phosphoglycerate mutase